jgi:hypothetical protein
MSNFQFFNLRVIRSFKVLETVYCGTDEDSSLGKELNY